MTPEECFARLWAHVSKELAAATNPHLANGHEVISYVPPSNQAQEGLNLRDAGEYFWSDGRPNIRLYRFDADLPEDRTNPDVTHAARDMCILAHEFGHFLFDPELERNSAEWTRFKARKLWDRADVNAIVHEEKQAWVLGRKTLQELEWTDFECFSEIQEASIEGYETGLSKLIPEDRR